MKTFKKLYAITFICIGFSLYIFPQQTISFEASEGFALGNVNTQNGWTTPPCGTNCVFANQDVSDEQATDGAFSLKIAVTPQFGETNLPNIGAYYDFTTPVDYTDAILSYDIFITQQDTDSSTFRLSVVGGQSFVFLIDFNSQGNVGIFNAAGTAIIDVATWDINTWYNVRAEITGSNIVYFIDDVEVASSLLLNDVDFTFLRFAHNNIGGEAYFDNLRINNEVLSIEEVSQNSFTHRYNKNFKTLNLESSTISMSGVEIYSLLGQKVISKSLTNTTETINVASLNDGVYLAKVNIDGNSKTIKFIKY